MTAKIRICNNDWYLIIQFCDPQLLTCCMYLNKYFKRLVFDNVMRKKWKREELESLIKANTESNCLAIKIIASNWIKELNYNHLFLLACEYGNSRIVFYFLLQEGLDNRKNVDPCSANNYAIRLASKNGHHKIVEILLLFDLVDPGAKDNYAIRYACLYGHLNVVKLLLSDYRVKFDSPKDKKNHIVVWAIKGNHIPVIELLLKDGRVDFSLEENWGIQMALENGNWELVKLLAKDKRVNPFNKKLKNFKELETIDKEEYFGSLLKEDEKKPSILCFC